MAEPEELEEDLFADLYDADESTKRTTSAVEPPKSVEPPSEVPAQQSYEESAPQSYDYSTNDTYTANAAPQVAYGSSYQNGPESVSTPADNEPQGTGIKEDG
ncbi:hypothetical protein N7495_006142 [Penicillium taxi]|uniref:uncharacterized protein n=1 Tax=Penicillium taxi TaxID=168475 RepID=UPI0025456B1D|nr:uncharacterized protein N7495_006142 [Penicillium taxi]KAJ5894451.1 hypothetical protein N7495_006142 [Penicillium taxi]